MRDGMGSAHKKYECLVIDTHNSLSMMAVPCWGSRRQLKFHLFAARSERKNEGRCTRNGMGGPGAYKIKGEKKKKRPVKMELACAPRGRWSTTGWLQNGKENLNHSMAMNMFAVLRLFCCKENVEIAVSHGGYNTGRHALFLQS